MEVRVIGEPGRRVWSEIMYWDSAFGVMVALLRVMMGGATLAGTAGAVRGEVVRMLEPAALVVVRIIAGRWAVEETMAPWALVEVVIVGRYAKTGAVERLVERTMLP